MRFKNRILPTLGFSLITFMALADTNVDIDNSATRPATRFENSGPYAVKNFAILASEPSKTQKWYDKWYIKHTVGSTSGAITGPLLRGYNMAMYNMLLAKAFPFLAEPDPPWLADLYNRLDELEENITSEIKNTILENEFSRAKGHITAGREYYAGYMSVSGRGDSFENELHALEPTPVHRGRAKSSYDQIQKGLDSLEMGLNELHRMLLDYQNDPIYENILESINTFLVTNLPYYAETGVESYQTYKWPKNSREAALQARYDDSIVQSWATDARNYVPSEYIRMFGANGPGEPYNYSPTFKYSNGMMAVSVEAYNNSTLLRYLETLSEYKEKVYEKIVDTSVSEVRVERDETIRSCPTPGATPIPSPCTITLKWEYVVDFYPLGSDELESHVVKGEGSYFMDDSSKERQVKEQKENDKQKAIQFRESKVLETEHGTALLLNATVNSLVRWVSELTGVDYTDTIDTSGAWEDDPEFDPQYYLARYDDLDEEEDISQYNFEGAYEHWLMEGKQAGRTAWFGENDLAALNHAEPFIAIYPTEDNAVYGVHAENSNLYKYDPSTSQWHIDTELPSLDRTVNADGWAAPPLTRLISAYGYTHPQKGKFALLGMGRDDGRIYYPDSAGEWYDLSHAFPGEDFFQTYRFIDLSVSQSDPNVWWAVTTSEKIFRIKLDDNLSDIEITEIRNNVSDPLIRILSYDDESTWAVSRDRGLYHLEFNTDTGRKEWVSKGGSQSIGEVKQLSLAGQNIWVLNNKGALFSYLDHIDHWVASGDYFEYITGGNDTRLYGLIKGQAYDYIKDHSHEEIEIIPSPPPVSDFKGFAERGGPIILGWSWDPPEQHQASGWDIKVFYKHEDDASFSEVEPYFANPNGPTPDNVSENLFMEDSWLSYSPNDRLEFYVLVTDKLYGTNSASYTLSCELGSSDYCEIVN